MARWKEVCVIAGANLVGAVQGAHDTTDAHRSLIAIWADPIYSKQAWLSGFRRASCKGDAIAADEMGSSPARAGILTGIDVDSNGTLDCVVVSGPPWTALALEPPTERTIYKVALPFIGDDLGLSIAGADDVDGDGVTEYFVGAPGSGGARRGELALLSGKTAAVLWQQVGTHDDERYGSAIKMVDDCDSDGYRDIVVGSPGLSRAAPVAGGVALVSAASGATIVSRSGVCEGGKFGAALAGVGAVGHGPDWSSPISTVAVVSSGSQAESDGERCPAVTLLSASDLSVIGSLSGVVPGLDGGMPWESIYSVGDCDGDGTSDLLFGASSVVGAAFDMPVVIVSGRSCRVLGAMMDERNEPITGGCVEVVDWDGDGSREIVIGTQWGGRLDSDGYECHIWKEVR